ncbi:hypothetical protein IQB76_19560, partial [Leptospira borgpetersenii serovar Hardjo-bovis]|nr:hypothetical protein [Leptospira borgpetersenii serovar Hardjo-bovis]
MNNIHTSIAGKRLRINNLLGNETYGKMFSYIEDEQREGVEVLFQDEEKKQDREVDLGHGQSCEDYYKADVSQCKIYIYSGTEGQRLD